MANIVNYLRGESPDADQRRSREGSAASPAVEVAGPGSYYADSGVGRWIGKGADGAGFALTGEVKAEQFERLLLGENPHTGEALMHNRGVSQRANQASTTPESRPTTGVDADGRSNEPGGLPTSRSTTDREPVSPGHSVAEPANGRSQGLVVDRDSDQISLAAFATESGIDDSYLRKVVRRTNSELAAQDDARAAGLPVPELSSTHLHATKQGKMWMIDRREADRFAAGRKPQQVVHGYDITFSAQKSVSVLWAASSPQVQHVIEDGLTHAVGEGMAYLEDEGFWVRQGRGEAHAEGMTAGAWRHHTSRALEPQLHDHVVIANMATNTNGEVRAVDARGLMSHATTAGHISDAALRQYLSSNLGVEWTKAEKGSAEIEGVPASAMREMSSRRAEVVSLSEEVGAFTARGRQTAALMTRSAKDNGVDAGELAAGWRATLSEHGLTREVANALTTGLGEQRSMPGLGVTERQTLFARMSSAEGVTKYASVFDRRGVIEHICNDIGGRLDTPTITGLADEWLAIAAVPLDITNTWQSIGAPGARVALSHDTVYSTPEMVSVEQRVLDRHAAGLNKGSAQVDPPTVEHAIAKLENKIGGEIGADQAAAVRAITQSGHQYQAVQGLAGAGKTTAMSAAVDAWQTAGVNVIGAAPFGTAARTLGEEIGITTQTLEAMLTFMEHNGPDRLLDANTVVLVDEASTISSRQLAQLYNAASSTGAAVRTVGDPQQHSAVEASGLWNAIVELNDAESPTLDVNRRQNPETMGVVRQALESYRDGNIGEALELLDQDGRIVTAESWPELLERLVEDWVPHYVDALENGTTPPAMIAERNRDKATLIPMAQQRLEALGVIDPTGITIGDARFHIGDRVIAQEQNRDLVAAGGGPKDYVLNGSVGRVTGFEGSAKHPDLVVDFEGLGKITLPHEFVAQEIGPGRGGGVAPAYAVTSHKVQGATFNASLSLSAEGAISKEGTYVAATRGKDDMALYSINPNHTLERVEAEITAVPDQRTMTEALRDSLTRTQRPQVATMADKGIAAALDNHAPTSRSNAIEQARLAGHAIANPSPTQLAAFGPRPQRSGAHRDAWDEAIATQRIYTHRYPTKGIEATSVPIPTQPAVANPTHETDHRNMVKATDTARRAGVASMPLEDMLAERADHRQNNTQGIHRRLDLAVRHTEHDLAIAQRTVDRVEATINAATRRNPAPPGIGAQLSQAHQGLGVAKAKHTNAVSDLAHYTTHGQAPTARRQLVEDAFTWRINTAATKPANYLTNAIGPRPTTTGRTEWDRAAHLVERVRHNHGLTPNHGPQPGTTPLARAVGQTNTSWQPLVNALQQLTGKLSPERSPERSNQPGIER